MERFSPYAPAVVRASVALVFLWFGVSQLLAPGDWLAWLPQWAFNLPLEAMTLVYLNGTFETVFGAALLAGYATRFAALLLSLHTLHVVSVVGYNDIGVRDFGLALATFAVFLRGPDAWSLDSRRAGA